MAAVGAPLAAQGLEPSQIGPGVAGFLAIFAITLASWVLFRSMNRHLRTVRRSPDPSAQRDGGTADGGPSDTGTSDGGTTGGETDPARPRRDDDPADGAAAGGDRSREQPGEQPPDPPSDPPPGQVPGPRR